MFDAPAVLLLALAAVVGCLVQPSLVAAQVTFHVPTIIGKVYYVDGFSSLNDSIAVGHGDDGIMYDARHVNPCSVLTMQLNTCCVLLQLCDRKWRLHLGSSVWRQWAGASCGCLPASP